MRYEEAAALQAEQGTDELISRLVDRYHQVSDAYEAVLVLGTDFADTGLPAELALNARLANEFGAAVLPVVAARDQAPEAVVAEVRNAHDAYASLGADLIAMVANRVADPEAAAAVRGLAERLPEPVFVLPEEPALAAPTVAQVKESTAAAKVLLGDHAGLSRDVRNLVFGGAHLPVFLPALTEGCLVVTPGDRSDLLIGALAAHSAGSPAIAGVLLTLDERPDDQTLALAARLAPGTPVLVVPEGSMPTADALLSLEGKLTAATPRKAEIALGLFETHVDAAQLSAQLSVERSERVTPMMFEHELVERSRAARRHIVLPEGTEERVLRAAEVLLRRNICDLTLLGDPAVIRKARRRAEHRSRPAGRRRGPRRTPLGPGRRHRAHRRSADLPAAGALRRGVRGAARAQGRHLRAGPRRGLRRVLLRHAHGQRGAGRRHGLRCRALDGGDGPPGLRDHPHPAGRLDRLLGVLHVPGRPGAGLRRLRRGAGPGRREQLADIAIQSATTAARFGVEPRVAMLSYSTGTSGSGADVDKVRRATELVRERRPDLLTEGPIQYDAAVEPSVAATKLPGSAVAGQATVLVFPDLNTGNNTYKAVQRSAGAIAVGPVLQGLRKPVNDLSRGALVQDIVNTVAITAVQAQDAFPHGSGG